ncbi:unnamed protein product, partial [Brassica napus]
QARFGSIEIDPDTVRPLKKRLKSDDACIVCEVSEEGASSCSWVDCLLRFHEECLTPEFGSLKSSHQPEEEEEDKVIEDEVEASAEDDERVSADDESVKRM